MITEPTDAIVRGRRGWHAAVCAGVQPGLTVAVVGDGAVGLFAVLAAAEPDARRVIAVSRHESRQRLAHEFGATDSVSPRGDDGVAAILQLTDGVGAGAVCEGVGTAESRVEPSDRARHGVRPRAAAGGDRRRVPGDGRAHGDQALLRPDLGTANTAPPVD